MAGRYSRRATTNHKKDVEAFQQACLTKRPILKQIHIGHHFYGSGNLGDDWMLAGFLNHIPESYQLSCCSPYDLRPLSLRFPRIHWMPYTEAYRKEAIANCDAWLGLGGSPFQHSVSSWFTDHLKSEAHWCKYDNKPMYFLGIGGQDEAAYRNTILKTVADQARHIWTRDESTYVAVKKLVKDNTRIDLASDLAHSFFETYSLQSIQSRTLATVLNFDYANWPNLNIAIQALNALPTDRKLWLIQESRVLPGAEQDLYKQLDNSLKSLWEIYLADIPGCSLKTLAEHWPSTEYLFTARFHSALASAWAGTKTVVINTNSKLESIALDLQVPLVGVNATPEMIIQAFSQAKPVPRALLSQKALLAKNAIKAFLDMIG